MIIENEAFIDGYLDELNDNIDLLDNDTIKLKNDPENEDVLNEILRLLHTVKGSSRMLKLNNIEKIVHGLENIFKGIKEKRYEIKKGIIQLVFISSDYLKKASSIIKEHRNDNFDNIMNIDKLIDIHDKAYNCLPYSIENLRIDDNADDNTIDDSDNHTEEIAVEIDEKITEDISEKTTEEKLDKKDDDTQKIDKKEIEKEKPDIKKIDKQPTHKPKPKVKKTNGKIELEQKSIRIDLDKVDDIIKSMNELIIKQFQIKSENDKIKDISNTINDLYLNKTKDRKTDKDIEDIETISNLNKDIQTIKKNLNEQFEIIERDTFKLQERLFSLRMLPLNLIMSSFPKMVEELSINLDKDINFTMKGIDQKLDKIILEKIKDPLIHLIRNSIDHGIESASEREKQGKPQKGSIEINCFSKSGRIIIEIIDDGKGIDHEKIKQKAINNQPDLEDKINSMTETELNEMLFLPGFSTKSKVSNISGRGVGLDLVRHNIENIKGNITLSSKKNEGTKFTLTLPLSLATVDGYFIKTSGHKFFIPANFVKKILMLKKEDILELQNSKAFKYKNKVIPLYNLSHILNVDDINHNDVQNVIVVHSYSEDIGIIIDCVIEYSSLIYKPLPKNLINHNSIQGIVFDQSFDIVNILYIPGIIKKFKNIRMIDLLQRYTKESVSIKKILVVDDSANTREIERSILEAENFNVTLAKDGIDALDKLRRDDFNLIITDINMPRMDGLTLIENIRRENTYKDLPIIVVSSLKEKQNDDIMAELKINDFIIKSDFDRGNLVNSVNKLIGII